MLPGGDSSTAPIAVSSGASASAGKTTKLKKQQQQQQVPRKMHVDKKVLKRKPLTQRNPVSSKDFPIHVKEEVMDEEEGAGHSLTGVHHKPAGSTASKKKVLNQIKPCY